MSTLQSFMVSFFIVRIASLGVLVNGEPQRREHWGIFLLPLPIVNQTFYEKKKTKSWCRYWLIDSSFFWLATKASYLSMSSFSFHSGCCDQKKKPATTETSVVNEERTPTITLSSMIFFITTTENVKERKRESMKRTILVMEFVRFGIGNK